jgi:MarR family transcriptional regulator, organic hydroperoxide resistance regulator
MHDAELFSTRVDDRLREAVWQVSRSVFMTLRRAVRQVQLTPPQYWILQMLDNRSPRPLGEISEDSDIRLATASGLIDNLVSRGLVRRRSSESDRRIVLVSLTDRGASALHAIRGRFQATWRRRLRAVPLKRQMEILNAITELSDHLGAAESGGMARPASRRPAPTREPRARRTAGVTP